MFKRIEESDLAEAEDIPKMTGMLIDLDILDFEEIIEILENKDSLKERIKEAYNILHDIED